MRKYAIVIEKGENNLSAYVPDLPDASPRARPRKRSSGISVQGLLEDGEPIHQPQTAVAYVELQGAG
jgi:predicted RNase H-like HicB family nuclease